MSQKTSKNDLYNVMIQSHTKRLKTSENCNRFFVILTFKTSRKRRKSITECLCAFTPWKFFWQVRTSRLTEISISSLINRDLILPNFLLQTLNFDNKIGKQRKLRFSCQFSLFLFNLSVCYCYILKICIL